MAEVLTDISGAIGGGADDSTIDLYASYEHAKWLLRHKKEGCNLRPKHHQPTEYIDATKLSPLWTALPSNMMARTISGAEPFFEFSYSRCLAYRAPFA